MQTEKPENSSALFLLMQDKYNATKQRKNCTDPNAPEQERSYLEGYTHALSWCLRQFREFIRISKLFNQLKK